MSVSLDAGDMLAQEAIDIGPEETAGEVEARLAPLGARLARQVIEQIQNGTVQGRKQDPSQVTKAPKLKKEHGLIDWSRTAEQVRDQIRAMQPWPTAHTFLHRQGQAPIRVIINRTGEIRLMRADPYPAPGTLLLFKDNDHLFVATGGQGAIEIRELQPAGKRRMTAEEFLRGRKPQAGDRFGPETS
jgi:methionyl-tRNA formyltransferase